MNGSFLITWNWTYNIKEIYLLYTTITSKWTGHRNVKFLSSTLGTKILVHISNFSSHPNKSKFAVLRVVVTYLSSCTSLLKLKNNKVKINMYSKNNAY